VNRKTMLITGAVALVVIVIVASVFTMTQTVKTAGSTTVFPLSQKWAEEYHKTYWQVTIQVAGGGTGAGIAQVAQGLIDIGAASSPLTPAQKQQYPFLVQIPVAIDALAIVVNPSVSDNLRLTRAMVVDIFDGKITTWSQFSSKYHVSIKATGQIQVYVRADASGTTDTFTRWLKTDPAWTRGSGEAITWPADPRFHAVQGNPGVAEGVKSDSNGIGYVGLAFVSGLTAATVQNPTTKEYVAPSYDSAKKAVPNEITDAGQLIMNSNVPGAYPIARLLYYIVNTNKVSKAALDYISWVISTDGGQQYVRAVGYIEISGTAVQTLSQKILSGLKPTS